MTPRGKRKAVKAKNKSELLEQTIHVFRPVMTNFRGKRIPSHVSINDMKAAIRLNTLIFQCALQ